MRGKWRDGSSLSNYNREADLLKTDASPVGLLAVFVSQAGSQMYLNIILSRVRVAKLFYTSCNVETQ